MGATDGNALAAGTAYAKKQGWTTVDKGIIGGAKIISQKWINQGEISQSTLYEMRWNPIYPGVKQYATDIKWAEKQAKFLYKQVKTLQEINKEYQPQFIIPRYRKEI